MAIRALEYEVFDDQAFKQAAVINLSPEQISDRCRLTFTPQADDHDLWFVARAALDGGISFVFLRQKGDNRNQTRIYLPRDIDAEAAAEAITQIFDGMSLTNPCFASSTFCANKNAIS
jgi:hypothetical protein